MNTPRNLADFLGRVLMSVIFVVSGLLQISNYVGTQAYMELHGVLGAFLPAVIAVEMVGAVAMAAGYKTRAFACLLAVFTLLTAILFHSDTSTSAQGVHFMKNLAMTGGFMVVLAHGAGEWSLDAYTQRLGRPGGHLRSA
jgi:putative oxidoreductase